MDRARSRHRQVGLAWSHFRIRVPLAKNADGAGVSPPIGDNAAVGDFDLSGTIFRAGHLPGARLAIDAITEMMMSAPKTAASIRIPHEDRSGLGIGWRPRIARAKFPFVNLEEFREFQPIVFVELGWGAAAEELLKIGSVPSQQSP